MEHNKLELLKKTDLVDQESHNMDLTQKLIREKKPAPNIIWHVFCVLSFQSILL